MKKNLLNMKKILSLLFAVLIFTSCASDYRSDDVFVIISKEKKDTYSSYTRDFQNIRDVQYKYLYRAQHFSPSLQIGLYFLGNCIFISNENYELGDTIKFIRCISNEN